MSKERRGKYIQSHKQYEIHRKQGMSRTKTVRNASFGGEKSVKEGSPEYEKWTQKELMQKAREVGIEKFPRMNKSELIFVLKNN